jgi:hypothetical protein
MLFAQISAGSGARKEKLNQNLEIKILEFKNLATQIEEMSEIYSQHHATTTSYTPPQSYSISTHRGPKMTSSHKKFDSNSKTTADMSRNPNSLQTSTKKQPKYPKNATRRPKASKYPKIISLVQKDGQIYMSLSNGDYIGPLKLSNAELNACASNFFFGRKG